MEILGIQNLSFQYPQGGKKALQNVSLGITEGEFIVLCGKSGCGKSTLLRHFKTVLTPHGATEGTVLYKGSPLAEVPQRVQAGAVGFVMQNPDSQIVTDKVWHELAFGLESLGIPPQNIRMRVAEMASYFGIESWYHKNTGALSGGQKQLLNLAGIMAMQPQVLVLDEPTSQLDPIAAADFLATIGKINRDLGITVVLSEHRLEEAFPHATRIVVMEEGCILADTTPRQVGAALREVGSELFTALPTPIQVWAGMETPTACPIHINEGRQWLSKIATRAETAEHEVPTANQRRNVPEITLEGVWFKYGREERDVLRNLNLQIQANQIHCILGGNGAGKSTLLGVLGKLHTPYRGKVKIRGKNVEHYSGEALYGGLLGSLPQNPQSLFVKGTVREDLLEMFPEKQRNCTETENKIGEVAAFFLLEEYMATHPYDLSGGEMQRLAFAKIMLLQPQIILLDEPTKGLDSGFKTVLANLLLQLKREGKTIVLVTHDVEFAARVADVCSFFFDGEVITSMPPRQFFSGNNFYTTSANKMARHLFPQAITAEEVVEMAKKYSKTQAQ